MPNPEISFYMTVRNGEKYIVKAINSVIFQDYEKWELVIVDDGSTDSTPLIIDQFAQKDERIHVVLTGGVGRGAALNCAISMCQADILTNLDADDIAHPERAKMLVELFTSNPEYAVITGKSEIILDDASPTWGGGAVEAASVTDISKKLAYGNPIGHSACGVKKDAVLSVGGYDESRHSQFDYDLWVRLIEAGFAVGRTKLLLAAKRSHSSQRFERVSHIRYVWESSKVQWRAIKALETPRVVGLLSIVSRLAWSIVPAEIRMTARKFLGQG